VTARRVVWYADIPRKQRADHRAIQVLGAVLWVLPFWPPLKGPVGCRFCRKGSYIQEQAVELFHLQCMTLSDGFLSLEGRRCLPLWTLQ